MCGEEKGFPEDVKALAEIPPRVRRRGFPGAPLRLRLGNTSACAEKSHKFWVTRFFIRKYLRVCGEEFCFMSEQ